MKTLVKYPFGTRKTVAYGIERFFKIIGNMNLTTVQMRCMAHVFNLHLKKGEEIKLLNVFSYTPRMKGNNMTIEVKVGEKEIHYYFDTRPLEMYKSKNPRVIRKSH